MDTISNYNLRRGVDTMVVYFAGHGGWDVTREDGHYIKARDANVYRSEIRQAMVRTEARLKILVTDCEALERGVFRSFSIQGKVIPPANIAPAFISLFWNPVGFVDINSASRGQIAMGDSVLGGLFTSRFTDHLGSNSQRGGITWHDFSEILRANTAKKFVEDHPGGFTYRSSGGQHITQKTQTVTARLQLANEPWALDNSSEFAAFRSLIKRSETNKTLPDPPVIPDKRCKW
jgi:hypothetical protein